MTIPVQMNFMEDVHNEHSLADAFRLDALRDDNTPGTYLVQALHYEMDSSRRDWLQMLVEENWVALAEHTTRGEAFVQASQDSARYPGVIVRVIEISPTNLYSKYLFWSGRNVTDSPRYYQNIQHSTEQKQNNRFHICKPWVLVTNRTRWRTDLDNYSFGNRLVLDRYLAEVQELMSRHAEYNGLIKVVQIESDQVEYYRGIARLESDPLA